MTGLVLDPLKGAQKGGFAGFGKGLVTGVLGVAAKPVSGALDLASQTVRGLGNTPGYLLQQKLSNSTIRPQRYIAPGGRLQPYDLAAAQRQLNTRTMQARAGTLVLSSEVSVPAGVLQGAQVDEAALKALHVRRVKIRDGDRVRFVFPTSGSRPDLVHPAFVFDFQFVMELTDRALSNSPARTTAWCSAHASCTWWHPARRGALFRSLTLTLSRAKKVHATSCCESFWDFFFNSNNPYPPRLDVHCAGRARASAPR